MADKQKPVHSVRIGAIKAAVWKNDTKNGLRFNVTFERLYKDEEENWNQTNSFGYKDLLTLAKVANQAHSWITDQMKSRKSR